MSTMRDEKGFSLIEALVALALLSVGALLFAQASLLSLKAGAVSRRDGQALSLAAEWAEKLRVLPWDALTGSCERPDGSQDKALCTVDRAGETCRVRLERRAGGPLRRKVAAACGGGGKEVVLETAVAERP